MFNRLIIVFATIFLHSCVGENTRLDAQVGPSADVSINSNQKIPDQLAAEFALSNEVPNCFIPSFEFSLAEIDRVFEFTGPIREFENWGSSSGVKWLSGREICNNGKWYFITTQGSLWIWDKSDTSLLFKDGFENSIGEAPKGHRSRRIDFNLSAGTISNPSLLFDAFQFKPTSILKLASDLDQVYTFDDKFNPTKFPNWGDVVWFQGKKILSNWYFITRDGAVYVWSPNDKSNAFQHYFPPLDLEYSSLKIGQVDLSYYSTPNKLIRGQNIEAPFKELSTIASGVNHTCAIINGQVQCWGGKQQDRITDVPANMEGVTQIVSGTNHVCSLGNVGVKCWGNNVAGQTSVPKDLGKVTQISAGGVHSCALLENRSVRCWGRPLGGGWPIMNNVDQIFSGQNSICTLANESVKCYGSGPTDRDSFFKKLSLGTDHSCGLGKDGSVHCWGSNQYGEIILPSSFSGIADVSTGRNNTCVIFENDNNIECFGKNSSGQVSSIPGGLKGPTKVSVGDYHACAMTDEGAICWGSNEYGQRDAPQLNKK